MGGTKLKVAVAGLGRMGTRHALHFHELTPRAELIAASSPDKGEIERARATFDGVALYESFEEMLQIEIKNGLQAVVVASATAVHAAQVIRAIELGLHVLCEKPLSTSAEISQTVVDAYNKSLKKYPNQRVICGFSRRFDASYRDAHAKMRSGLIGHPTVFRSQTCDKLDPSGFFVAYAQFSGGIFVDCSIHDIDLALWFFGEDQRVKSVNAIGVTAVQPDLRKHNDRDNALGMIEFYGGKIAQLYCSRMNAAGQEDTTEITGTSGKITVNMTPQSNLVHMYEPTGIRREIGQTYYDRFREAFIAEANEFTACCLDGKDIGMKLEGAVAAVRIAQALQESMITGRIIEFDQAGNRIVKQERQVQARL